MWGKNRHLIGLDRDSCIIRSGTGLYDTPALECNIGIVENLTIISANDDSLSEDSQTSKSYGIHVEASNTNEFQLTIKNCKVISYLNSAIGIGCRYNQTINLIDCYFESLATKVWSAYYNTYIDTAGVLFHNDAEYSGQGPYNSHLNIINCEIHGKTRGILAQSMENNNEMEVKLIGNLVYFGDSINLENVVGFWGNTQKGQSPYFAGTDIKLSKLSYNNRSNEVDFDNYWN